MPINDNATILAEYGTLFYAPVGTALPSGGIKAFKLNADEVDGGWKNLGHTSAENKVTINLEGGDAEQYASWIKKNLRTKYSDSTMSINATSIQMDKDTFKLIYNGTDGAKGGVSSNVAKKPSSYALVLLAQETPDDNEKIKFAMHFKKCSITPNGGPSFTKNFVEQGLIAQVESAPGDEQDFDTYFPSDFAATTTK